MQIDTYVVKIKPDFDIASFGKIKKKIETLKSPVKIPTSIIFNTSTLKGLKTKIQQEVSKNNIKLKLPVEPILTGTSLKNLKAGLSFKPIQIPAVLKFDNSSLAIIKQLWSQAGIMPKSASSRSKSASNAQNILQNDNNPNGKYLDIINKAISSTLKAPLGAAKTTAKLSGRIAEYGLGGAFAYGAAKMVASPFVVEDNLYKLKSISDYTYGNMEEMKRVIKEISRELPIMTSELSTTAVTAARANVSMSDLFGVQQGKDDVYKTKNSQLYLIAKLAAYTDESTDDVYNLIKQMRTAFPDLNIKNLGNLLTGASDLTHWNFNQMQSYLSAVSPGIIKEMNIDPKTLLGIMSLQSMSWKTPSDAGTSLKTFNQFTKNAKSDKAQAMMTDLGLSRWNKQGTDLDNFRTYLLEINQLYDELDKNGGKISRVVTKTVGKGKNKKTIKENTVLNRETVEGMVYQITGSDAARFASMLSIEDLKKVLADFDKVLENADLDKKLAIRGQSAIYKLRLLFSEIETGFIEAFDTQTIANTGDLFKDLGAGVAKVVNLLHELGGFSGIWDKFMDSKFIYYLQEAGDMIKRILSMLGIDIDAKFNAMRDAANARLRENIAKGSEDHTINSPTYRTPLTQLIQDGKPLNDKSVLNVTIGNVQAQSPYDAGLQIGKGIHDVYESKFPSKSTRNQINDANHNLLPSSGDF